MPKSLILEMSVNDVCKEFALVGGRVPIHSVEHCVDIIRDDVGTDLKRKLLCQRNTMTLILPQSLLELLNIRSLQIRSLWHGASDSRLTRDQCVLLLANFIVLLHHLFHYLLRSIGIDSNSWYRY